jgi:MFS transporter, FSR family, fosmidomycin resistance protein
MFLKRRLRRVSLFVFVLLLIEFADEFVFGILGAAWPLMRADLHLTYIQIGLLLGLPSIIADVIETFFGILADVGYRRRLILGGGALFALACLLTAISGDFLALLASFILFYPASGAFVSLSQATLMDYDPERREQNMARWTFSGSLAVVVGPLVLGAAALIGAGWRELFFLCALVAFVALILLRRSINGTKLAPSADDEEEESPGFIDGLRQAIAAMRQRNVLKWVLLLEFSDLLLDVLHGYIALYFVDVVGADYALGGVAVLVWTGVGMLGDFLLIPLLERVKGMDYLRYSVLAELILFPAFLLVPGILPKLVILALLGIFNAGWYAVLQAQLYEAMPGRSGTVLSVMNVIGLPAALIPVAIGFVAEQWSLNAAMWLLLLGPIALLIGVGLPRWKRTHRTPALQDAL